MPTSEPLLPRLYRHSLALLTDLYQLTMAAGYWKLRLADTHAAFHVQFRRTPFHGGYALAAGLATAIDYIENLRFTPDDLAYLATLAGNDARPLFEPAFLDHLANLRFTCDVDALPEGTLVFGNEPLLRITGPILQAQLLETPLLTLLNFQTLLATKSARVCQAAAGQPVLEFGLRRAQGIDGGLSAARAAYIGGCAATSNVLAGKLFDIPVKGTHAHSWVMLFDDELEAFAQYAQALPNNCIFLVDTYDTRRGVRHAVEIGQRLRALGHEMIGIRLDSGDLLPLSLDARRQLDAAGFTKAVIVASGDLDEYAIESLKAHGSPINVWGVGTRLTTAYDQPALGGVYKLTAVRHGDEPWHYRLKLSEELAKTSLPGLLQVRRFRDAAGQFLGDAIYNEPAGLSCPCTITDPNDPSRTHTFPPDAAHDDLLVPIFRHGRRVYDIPSLGASRTRAAQQLASLSAPVKRLANPDPYPVGLDQRLHDLRADLVKTARSRP